MGDLGGWLREQRPVDDARLEPAAARGEGLEIVPHVRPEARRAAASDGHVDHDVWHVSEACSVYVNGAQHPVVVGCGGKRQVKGPDGLGELPPDVEGRVRRHPSGCEATGWARRATPAPHDTVLLVVEIEVAVDGVVSLKCLRGSAQHAGIVVAVVGVEDTHGVASIDREALVEGVIHAPVGLTQDADVWALEALGNGNRMVGGSAVDDEQFLVRVVLRQEGGNGPRNRRIRVAADGQHGDLHLAMRAVTAPRGS